MLRKLVASGELAYLDLAHVIDATQIGGFGMLKFFELAHMFDATQIGGFGVLTFLHTCWMLRKLVASGC